MSKNFVIRPKGADEKEDKTVTMTIRIDKDLQGEYGKLAKESGRSRNEIICMALSYALENLELRLDDTNNK